MYEELLIELDDLGFPMLADWIRQDQIDYQESLKHLDENKSMMDDQEDRIAFQRAEEIIRKIN